MNCTSDEQETCQVEKRGCERLLLRKRQMENCNNVIWIGY